MKKKTLDQIDANLEVIIQKMVEEGKIGEPEGSHRGFLNPPAHDALRLAQETLSLLRKERK